MSFLGVPYRWGGSNPITGLDCSGLTIEILKSAGVAPPGDTTAQGLYNFYEKTGTVGVFGPGVLAFYGESVTKITHVGFMIDEFRMIEAGGGNSQIFSKEDAALHDAFVRIRPVRRRKDFVITVKPRYASIGLI